MNKWQLTLSATAMIMVSQPLLATPFGSVDARTTGMGGIGVSSGFIYAPNNNPALAIVKRIHQDVYVYPTFSGTLHDKHDLYNGVDEFQSLASALESNPSAANQAAVASKLSELQGQQFSAEYYSGIAVAVPSKVFGGGFFMTSSTYVTATANVGNNQDLAAATPVYDAQLSYKGVNTTEIGFAIAFKTNNPSLRNMHFGFTPKLSHFNLFEGAEELATTDKHVNSGTNTLASDFNLDFGLLYKFNPMLSAGLAAKSILPYTYHFPDGQELNHHPRIRGGATYHANWYRIAMEMDVTENSAVGLGNKSQNVSIGTELFSRYFSFRTGYKYNLLDPDASSLSIGVGTSGTPFLMDVAFVMGEVESGAAMNIGFSF